MPSVRGSEGRYETARGERATRFRINLGVFDGRLNLLGCQVRVVFGDYADGLPSSKGSGDMDGHAGAAQFGSDPAFVDERIHLFDTFQAFVDAAIENR